MTAQTTTRTPLPGTTVKPLPGAQRTGPVPADERFEVTVRVRRRTPIGASASQGTLADQPPAHRRYLSREEYAASHGADPADLQAVADFAASFGLVVVEASAARRSVFLSGTAVQFEAAFGAQIGHYEFDGGSYRSREGHLSVPAPLAGIVEGVFGFDDRQIARPHFQTRPQPGTPGTSGHAGVQRPHTTQPAAFTPPEVAQLYDFPQDADGAGQCIALIELGGGYRTTDLKAYFKSLGIAAPKVTAVRVDSASNRPTTGDGPDGEVMLDIEVAAAVAPKAQIVVYFAPNTSKGFLDAITKALHDTTHKPSVVSISWGGPESGWTAQAMKSFDDAFQTAAALGVTVCCAAGDQGSSDGETDGLSHVDFPGSSPHVLCCGGTRLVGSGSTIKAETVWNDDASSSATGGGVSDQFDPPDYQGSVDVPPSANAGGRRGRGVPDVCGNADPDTGYKVRVDGEDAVIGGTSAVAPLWAGLVALLNQQLGHPVGFLNPLLYGTLQAQGALRDIVEGDNGAYQAGKGWDACSGLGSPKGTAILQALKAPAK